MNVKHVNPEDRNAVEVTSGRRVFDPTSDKVRLDIGYQAAHDRVRAYLGSPSEHICAIHGDHAAQEFALVFGSEYEMVVPEGLRHGGKHYSPVPADYIPLCISAHRRMDWAQSKLRKAEAAFNAAMDDVAQKAAALSSARAHVNNVAVTR
jgi:hypothetical protein